MSDQEEKELFMLDTFQQLPKANKLTALYLFEHLRRYGIYPKIELFSSAATKTFFVRLFIPRFL